MMAVSGKPDAVFLLRHPFCGRRMIMAAWSGLTDLICVAGLLAAVVVLLIVVIGFFVIMYGINHFDEWDKKW